MCPGSAAADEGELGFSQQVLFVLKSGGVRRWLVVQDLILKISQGYFQG